MFQNHSVKLNITNSLNLILAFFPSGRKGVHKAPRQISFKNIIKASIPVHARACPRKRASFSAQKLSSLWMCIRQRAEK